MKKFLTTLVIIGSMVGLSHAELIDDAVSWMYKNGLTIHNKTSDYKPNNYIRRDEAAKLFVKFAKLKKKDTYVKTAEKCKFSDIKEGNKNLYSMIIESCRLGIFGGANGKFMPKLSLTNEQAVTILIRILEGNQDEKNVSYRSESYYKKANEIGLLKNLNVNNRKGSATRGSVGIMIYDSHLQQSNITQSNISTQSCSPTTYNLTTKMAVKIGNDPKIELINIGINEEGTIKIDNVIYTIAKDETKIVNGTYFQNDGLENGMLRLNITCDHLPTIAKSGNILDCYSSDLSKLVCDSNNLMGFLSLFEQRLETCEQSQGTFALGFEPSIGILREYHIQNESNGKCQIQFSFLNNTIIDKSLLNKSMICEYDISKRSLEDINSCFEECCSGSLVDAINTYMKSIHIGKYK